MDWSDRHQPDAESGNGPPVGNKVDTLKGFYQSTIGAVELSSVWTDPDIDPGIDAFCYARVLEIQTPRRSTSQAAQQGLVPPSGAGFQGIVQRRAWATPICYTPDDSARESAPDGVTVAELKKQGAVAFDEAELGALIVGKTISLYNTVTDQPFEILHG